MLSRILDWKQIAIVFVYLDVAHIRSTARCLASQDGVGGAFNVGWVASTGVQSRVHWGDKGKRSPLCTVLAGASGYRSARMG